MFEQGGLNLTWFDPVPPQLHLVIHSADEMQVSVLPPANLISRPV
jgi:hypothetical protein